MKTFLSAMTGTLLGVIVGALGMAMLVVSDPEIAEFAVMKAKEIEGVRKEA